ncbi:helix-turn-helix domain-containing protein [Serratia fonticola]|jgi:DNA-binding winged helix-turn-helix (wHTH) protein|uniref:winged helix-turn-helix domain-containing protein n=1 Tax=Serratia fonticola TaxID=47917 RepID=UPI00217CAFC4|nr:helix-turn-helix domain-containing protein [Serratia fonticola]CAI0995603.1 Transcriptional regulatory protein, C terminal [Serratia fonticola]CAI1199874.1 Transcriptional regulatory protein, C terminal [Serratia fonticola]
MEYIIEGGIKYNSSNGTLYIADSGMNMITLARVTNEILLLFIQHNHVPLKRDFILSELWEKKGLTSSSNGLNNYVSMLRKALAECGYPDLITTIPKHGFIFEAEILNVAISDVQFVDVHLVPDSVPQLPPVHETGKQRNPVRQYLTTRVMIASSILSTLLIVVFLFYIYNSYNFRAIKTEFFTYKQCQFYLADDKTREIATSNIIDNIKANAAEINLNCERKANVYYFADNKVDSSGSVILKDLVSYCHYKSKTPCDNYYLTRHINKGDHEK